MTGADSRDGRDAGLALALRRTTPRDIELLLLLLLLIRHGVNVLDQSRPAIWGERAASAAPAVNPRWIRSCHWACMGLGAADDGSPISRIFPTLGARAPSVGDAAAIRSSWWRLKR